MVEVVQADRDAVQAFHREMGRRLMQDIKHGTNLLDAKGDDSDTIYQAFAAHRIAAISTLQAQYERLRVALEAAGRLVSVFDELRATTTAERIITGRSDRDLRLASEQAMTDLRAGLAALAALASLDQEGQDA